MISEESDTGSDSGRSSPDPDARLKRRLDELDRKLDAREQNELARADAARGNRVSAVGKALRLSTELVVGVVGGAFIGYVIDELAGTRPWFLLVFLMLGVAAGLTNAMRTARQLSNNNDGMR